MNWADFSVALTVGATAATITLLMLRARDRAALLRFSRALEALGQGRAPRPLAPHVKGQVAHPARRFARVAAALVQRIAAMKSEREQLDAVLSGMAEAVIAVDRHSRLVFANPGADELFGLDQKAVGRLVPEVIRSPQIHRAIEETLARTEPYQGEVTILDDSVAASTRAVSERVVAIHGAPLPGAPTHGAVLVLHDVTELRRLERMRRDFVANVSHELKTPLASIIAYVETLQAGALQDESCNERFVNQIGEQAERLNKLIMDLLSLAKIEAIREFRFEAQDPIELASRVRSRAEAHRDRAMAQGLRYSVQIQPEAEPAQVRGDEEAIRQVLDNLIDNAIKYTPSGGLVRVVCRVDDPSAISEPNPRRRILSRLQPAPPRLTDQNAPPGPQAIIEVVDTGLGIPREDLTRIFERFYRVDKARSRELGGTGLGLSIVKHLVQALNGSIEVDSRLGAGSLFRVRLPRTDLENPEPDTETQEESSPVGPSTPPSTSSGTPRRSLVEANVAEPTGPIGSDPSPRLPEASRSA